MFFIPSRALQLIQTRLGYTAPINSTTPTKLRLGLWSAEDGHLRSVWLSGSSWCIHRQEILYAALFAGQLCRHAILRLIPLFSLTSTTAGSSQHAPIPLAVLSFPLWRRDKFRRRSSSGSVDASDLFKYSRHGKQTTMDEQRVTEAAARQNNTLWLYIRAAKFQ